MKIKQLLSTSEVAKLLGISRVAVFKKIQKGVLKAQKIGRNYAVDARDVGIILGTDLTGENKKIIDQTVQRTIKEYGETLRLLGQE